MVTCSFTVTVIDEEAPVLTCPTAVVGTLDANQCDYTYTPQIMGTAVSDNCTADGALTITYSVENPDNSISGPFANGTAYNFTTGVSQVVYTVADAAGNATICVQQVTVTDAQAPQITCSTGSPFTRSNTTGLCGYVAVGTEFNATATDNCGAVTLTHNYGAWGNANSLAGAEFPVGTTVVTWTATDAAGNTNTCDITIIVNDTEDPEFVNCPSGTTFTIGADADCETGIIWSIPVAQDNCGAVTVIETSTDGPYYGDELAPGTYLIEYTAVDGSLNMATCNFTIIVVDDSDPLLICPEDMMVVADAGVCTWTSELDELNPLLAVDNCPGFTLTHSINGGAPVSGVVPAGTVFAAGVTTVMYTLSDNATPPNVVSCSFTVSVIDEEAPVFTCPAPVVTTLDADECDYTYTPQILATAVSDNCTADAALSITYRVENPNNSISGPYANGTPYNFVVGISQVEYTVTDAAGNTTTCTQQVTVTDGEAPVITCPAGSPFTMDNSAGLCGYVADGTEFDATATDNCSGVIVTHNYSAWGNPNSLAGATFPVGTTVVTWTATDASGNSVTCDITITVNDTEDPEFVNCPSGTTFTIGADADCENGVIWSIPVAQDNCGVVTVTETTAGGPLYGTPLAPGTYNIQYTATDGATPPNTATCDFTVIVVDDSDPLLVCPEDMTVGADAGVCTWTSAAGELNPLLAVDNCPDYILTHSINAGAPVNGVVPAGTVFTLGTTTVTYTLSDDATPPNVVTCSFTVTVIDEEAPVVNCPEPLVLECGDATNATQITSWIATATAIDNCDLDPDITWLIFSEDTQCGDTKTSLYQFTATDAAGNSSVCYTTVTIVDTTIPTISTPAADLTVECNGSGNTAELLNWLNIHGGAVATDACGSVSWTHNFGVLSDGCGSTGVVTVTFTATDECGNQNTTTATFTIEDTEAPVWILLPQNLTVECDGSGDPYGQNGPIHL
ncbi:MAG: HYR domain-containing protein [Ignavibacteriales bacterium]|nr:HYR domain-containing protein [Ignavibacteriales bacterium]